MGSSHLPVQLAFSSSHKTGVPHISSLLLHLMLWGAKIFVVVMGTYKLLTVQSLQISNALFLLSEGTTLNPRIAIHLYLEA